MKIGYCRVSTQDQKLDLQKDALKKFGCEKIFEDKISGMKFQREGLDEVLNYMRKGDTLVVWKLDRLGRGLRDLLDIINTLKEKGIEFCSITENIDTTSPTGKLTFHIFAFLAEYERDKIRERTNAGLKAARARGKVGGRPTKITKELIKQVHTLHKNPDISINEIISILGIGRTTFYKILKIK